MTQQEKILPITSESWDEAGDYGNIQFYNVTFLEDFGPFKKGEKVDCLFFQMLEGKISSLDNDGKQQQTFSVKLVPCTDSK